MHYWWTHHGGMCCDTTWISIIFLIKFSILVKFCLFCSKCYCPSCWCAASYQWTSLLSTSPIELWLSFTDRSLVPDLKIWVLPTLLPSVSPLYIELEKCTHSGQCLQHRQKEDVATSIWLIGRYQNKILYRNKSCIILIPGEIWKMYKPF